MPVNTPEPRLPLEPEQYPLYKPPSRIGCSALSVIALLFLLVFALLSWKVTPQVAKAIVDVPRGLIPGAGSDISADTTPGTGSLSTQTAVPAPSPTLPPIATPTPNIEYVQVANTSGQGVRLRADAASSAKYSVVVDDGAVLMVIGSDVTNGEGTWRHVQLLPPDGRAGYILSKYLIAASRP